MDFDNNRCSRFGIAMSLFNKSGKCDVDCLRDIFMNMDHVNIYNQIMGVNLKTIVLKVFVNILTSLRYGGQKIRASKY